MATVELKSISELFGLQFFIPSYQRGYRWTTVQVRELLEDLYDFSDDNKREDDDYYCLQPVIVKGRGEQWELVDGQQRLTAIWLFFIADSFDYNTINIWKAVAAVPLQSSNDKDKFTDNVVIMPVNTDELSSLIDKSSEYDEIISKVHKLFEVDKINFDIEWREKFMGAII